MAESYTAWLWRARSVIGKKGMYTTRHRMDEAGASEYFAKEGITEYFKLENSAVVRERNPTQEELRANSPHVLRPGDPGYPANISPIPRYLRCVDESTVETTPPSSE